MTKRNGQDSTPAHRMTRKIMPQYDKEKERHGMTILITPGMTKNKVTRIQGWQHI